MEIPRSETVWKGYVLHIGVAISPQSKFKTCDDWPTNRQRH